jgi:hypothetical protein
VGTLGLLPGSSSGAVWMSDVEFSLKQIEDVMTRVLLRISEMIVDIRKDTEVAIISGIGSRDQFQVQRQRDESG